MSAASGDERSSRLQPSSAAPSGPSDPDPRLLDLVATYTPATVSVFVTVSEVADGLTDRGIDARAVDLHATPPRSLDVVALIGGELSRAGAHAEGVLAAAAAALRPGGLLVAAARNRIHAEAAGLLLGGLRGWSADELVRAVGHPGIAVEHVAAPGAAAMLRGDPCGDVDAELDRQPGLLDAAGQTLVIGRKGADEAARSAAFVASVPRKIVAAAVVCTDDAGRLLCVHDSFKGHWTIPGGIVDADEDPRSGAEREAWEEAGIRVTAGDLLGVFAMPWPDRVLFCYAATPTGDPTPTPLHAHEISAAEWVPLQAALQRLNPRTSSQVRRCLSEPGGTWPEAG
jgi:8-oxo-dGTP pyrophosphatase MutT (NUDIX family)